MLEVVQDRLRARVSEALDRARGRGAGRLRDAALQARARVSVYLQERPTRAHAGMAAVRALLRRPALRGLRSPLRDPLPSLFSFNSPLGACETCRGFGRVIGIDYGLVVPDDVKTLREGAVRPWQTPSFRNARTT